MCTISKQTAPSCHLDTTPAPSGSSGSLAPNVTQSNETHAPSPSLGLSDLCKEVMFEQVEVCMHLIAVDHGREDSKEISCCLSGAFCNEGCLILVECQVFRKGRSGRLVVLNRTHHHHCRPTRPETDSNSDEIHAYHRSTVEQSLQLDPNHRRRHRSRPPSTPLRLTLP
jgi:hypothetical protein